MLPDSLTKPGSLSQKKGREAGETAQWLTPLVLTEDPGSIPSNHTAAHNQPLTPILGDPFLLLTSRDTRHIRETKAHMWANHSYDISNLDF